MAQTAANLAQTLKEVWSSDRMNEQIAFRNIVSGTPRFHVDPNIPSNQVYGLRLNTSPEAVRFRNQRQEILMQNLAAKKRGNKPSYRERQRRGRASRRDSLVRNG